MGLLRAVLPKCVPSTEGQTSPGSLLEMETPRPNPGPSPDLGNSCAHSLSSMGLAQGPLLSKSNAVLSDHQFLEYTT